MRITIQLPDDLYDELAEKAKDHNVRPTTYIGDLVKTFGYIDPRDRILIVPREIRSALEELLGGGHLQNPQDLLEKVRKVCALSIEEIQLHFTSAQKAELKRQADRQGISYEEHLTRTVRSIESHFFNVAH